jgi:hypothetical protein
MENNEGGRLRRVLHISFASGPTLVLVDELDLVERI